MKQFIISVLNSYFLNCNYAPAVVVYKLEDMTDGDYKVKESHTSSLATLRVGNLFTIYMGLSEHGYIKSIDIE